MNYIPPYQTIDQYLRKQKIKNIGQELTVFLERDSRFLRTLQGDVFFVIWWKFDNEAWDVVHAPFPEIGIHIGNNLEIKE